MYNMSLLPLYEQNGQNDNFFTVLPSVFDFGSRAGASDCPCGVAPAGDKQLWLSPLQKPSEDWDALEPRLPSRVP